MIDSHLTVSIPPPPTKWYAVVTTPRHEKSASAYLKMFGVETFLPTFEQTNIWKNRQKVVVTTPLFPTYLFVRMEHREKGKVLSAPGVRQVVGNSQGPLSLPDEDVDALLRIVSNQKVQPFAGLVAGQKVRINGGALQGIEGYLVRQSNDCRFVLSVQLINQHAAVEVDASLLQSIPAEGSAKGAAPSRSSSGVSQPQPCQQIASQ